MTASLPANDRLYRLLPTIYRLRDAAGGEPLRALLAVVQEQLQRVEDNIGDLYENWFIETCDEWVVPYIGDLLAVRGQFSVDNARLTLRPYVANTLHYRRKKGTAAMLEGLARDVTGWRTRALELFQVLPVNVNLNHRRPLPRTPNLRDTSTLELLDGPFDPIGHFVDVRRIESGRGRYNIPNVALFAWRLMSLAIDAAPATADPGAGAGRFRFSQLGLDAPLFGPERRVDELADRRVRESDATGPLRPRAVGAELDAARSALSATELPGYAYFADGEPCLQLVTVGDPLGDGPLAPDQIQICDLRDWAASLPKQLPYTKDHQVTRTRVAIDVRLGRVAFLDGQPPASLQVGYSYGFSAPLGGGTYPRQDTLPPPAATADRPAPTVYAVPPADPSKAAGDGFVKQLAQWALDQFPDAIFEFRDSGAYLVGDVAVPARTRVRIRAVDQQRPVLRLGATWRLALGEFAELELNGLVISGARVEVRTQQAVASAVSDHGLDLRHCTLVPGLLLDSAGAPSTADGREARSLSVAAASLGRLTLTVDRAIVGRLDFAGTSSDFESVLAVRDSIVDGTGGTANAIHQAGDCQLERATILGTTTCRTLYASDVLFDGKVLCERTQTGRDAGHPGCVRFSYVPKDRTPPADPNEPQDSTVPKRYHCQPDLAIAADPPSEQETRDRLTPSYTSRKYGDPGYAQLSRQCAAELKSGASDGSEVGAFQLLHQPQRESNLRIALDEYLRFGIEAGIFYVT